jgi:hypothetical protein
VNNASTSTYTIIGTGDPIEEKDMVEFRLLYEGELLACTNANRRPKEKHAIRRIFHPQLRRLWTTNLNLRQLAVSQYAKALADGEPHPATEPERFELGLAVIGKNHSAVGFDLVPLVTPDLALRCSLDILLLRPEEDRFIFTKGDIDGQLKTLLDALQVPDSWEQTGKSVPQEDETPFFCLLKNDKLISEVHITTNQLLLLPNRKELKANDSFVVIHVKVNNKSARFFDDYFGD